MRQEGDTEQRIARLEEEIRLRDEFISIAAHELRNPLTPIALDVEVLLTHAQRREQVNPAEIASLERLQRNLHTFLRRASTLLDVTRLQSGQLSLEKRSVVLTEIVRDVVMSSAPLAKQARCDLRFEADDAVVGECDPQALERIVENLLSNALRFGAGLPVDIRLSRAGETAELEVADHGIGIPPGEQERIFCRFHRARGSNAPGFGVGLWITRELARAMDGDVTVSSSLGKGATFILRMPLHTRRDAAHVDP
jgi:signal transduction histidine kinase